MRGTLAAPVVLSLLLAGCSFSYGEDPSSLPAPSLQPSPVAPSGETSDPAAGLERYYEQDVRWRSCRTDNLCATIQVPLDYAEPDGETIDLALLKVEAASPKQRVGSLVINPGGPGGSGVGYASRASTHFGTELLAAFDIVGFDPRGVGESTPIQCLPDERLDSFVAADPDPDTPAEIADAERQLREFGQGCLDESGKLAEHVSTVEVARDLDIIRAVVGDRRLSYFGASYGTFIGATYAELFPEHVGRMVLDGAIDPSLGAKETSLIQAAGFETALRAYVESCTSGPDCFLGPDVDAGAERIRTFLDEVESEPLSTSSDRELTVGNAVLGIWAPLYNENYWYLLDAALKSAFNGDGTALLSLSDAYTSRGPSGYVDNSIEALYSVNCLDEDDTIPMSEVPAMVPEFEKASPTFGAIFAWGLAGCHSWPVQGEQIAGPLTAVGAAPILVIGTTRDPATPVEWAEALAEQLESGVLVRRDGDGHTGYKAGNQCVDDVVESYLVSGKVPQGDVDC